MMVPPGCGVCASGRTGLVDTGEISISTAVANGLRADLLGVRTALINQPVEVPQLRPELATALGTSDRPQLLIRFGHAPYAPYSLRRPVDDIITS